MSEILEGTVNGLPCLSIEYEDGRTYRRADTGQRVKLTSQTPPMAGIPEGWFSRE